MESQEASGVGEVSQQCGDVAVADENLGMSLDLFEIQLFEQVVRAIPSASTDDCSHIVAHEHFFEFAGAATRRSSEIKILLENRVEIERLVSRAAQGFAARFEISPIDVASRRNDSHGVAKAKNGRLHGLAG